MTTNYFKVAAVGLHPQTSKPFTDSKAFFFFDDRSPDLIRSAFDRATEESARLGGCKISVYRRPKIGGPWDSVQTVGVGIGELATAPEDTN